jgi:urate oxidase
VAVTFGDNQYGKAEVRLVHVTRDSDRHEIRDLNVSTALRGDFDAAHLVGDNSHVVATDTQKNTVYALAQQHGVGQIEEFGLRLGRHFVDSFGWVTGAKISIEEYSWDRIPAGGAGSAGSASRAEHGHAFTRTGGGTRTTVVTIDGEQAWVVSGVTGLVVLKTTGSEFTGFPRDRYTTLAEDRDRILATAVTARWRYAGSTVDWATDWAKSYADVRRILLETFAAKHSLALQQTLYQMGEQVLLAHPEVAEIRMSMPNKHHFLVDLSPFGLPNDREVYYAADRPYGLIEGTVTRDDAPPAGRAWQSVPSF